LTKSSLSLLMVPSRSRMTSFMVLALAETVSLRR
jgi:hypothetical protein